ncbi:sensor domain-containing diguanylate cyclase [Acanthopleuribacter pedis]|uniref:diguanylate cyclase n=1 Tax=Acanthopleuribacter pedis TaxID=442870 RepID=A0A8J7U5X0_9BACT|nr:diguanylate cyclase [Acanthopleuribacter pedis]MBO1319746.1 sensor domain-containing diguanylate cyclase [Acanthopleuribacter pedis]
MEIKLTISIFCANDQKIETWRDVLHDLDVELLFTFDEARYFEQAVAEALSTVHLIDLTETGLSDFWLEELLAKPRTVPPLLVVTERMLAVNPSLPPSIDVTLPSPALVRNKVTAMLAYSRNLLKMRWQEQRVSQVEAKLRKEIAYHKETERILSENERTLRSIYRSIEATGESVLITDKSETVYYVNPAFSRLSGFDADEVFGSTADEFFRFDHSPVDLGTMKTIARETGSWQGDVTMQRKNGELYDAFLDLNSVADANHNFEGFIFIQRDITAIKKMMHDLERLARIDSLTGLYNRRYFMERFEEEMIRGRRYNRPTTLLLLDLDHFKDVNDSFGHSSGDRVLERVGYLIEKQMRTTDFAGRYGGEELCVALPETSLEGGCIFAERLRVRIQEESFRTDDDRLFNVTCSVGVVLLDSKDQNIAYYFSVADQALYRAKKLGRNRVEVG